MSPELSLAIIWRGPALCLHCFPTRCGLITSFGESLVPAFELSSSILALISSELDTRMQDNLIRERRQYCSSFSRFLQTFMFCNCICSVFSSIMFEISSQREYSLNRLCYFYVICGDGYRMTYWGWKHCMLESNWKSWSANVDMPMRDGDDDRPVGGVSYSFYEGNLLLNFFWRKGVVIDRPQMI